MWLGLPKPMIPYLLEQGAVRSVGSHLGRILFGGARPRGKSPPIVPPPT